MPARTGDPVGTSFIIPKTSEGLRKRRRMMQAWAEHTCGMMRRSPDFVNINMMGFALWHTHPHPGEPADRSLEAACGAARSLSSISRWPCWTAPSPFPCGDLLLVSPAAKCPAPLVPCIAAISPTALLKPRTAISASPPTSNIIGSVFARQMAVEVDHPQAGRITLAWSKFKKKCRGSTWDLNLGTRTGRGRHRRLIGLPEYGICCQMGVGLSQVGGDCKP